VEGAVLAHGEGRVVFEPRVHLVPDNNGAGHFNVLRGHLPTPGAGGVMGGNSEGRGADAGTMLRYR
jgi:ornithine cyclodeaminase